MKRRDRERVKRGDRESKRVRERVKRRDRESERE